MRIPLKWISNPFAKTTLSQLGGAVGSIVFNQIDLALLHPTGGTQSFLATHHLWYVGYSVGVGVIHNAISNAFPPGGLPPEPKGSTVEPLQVTHPVEGSH